MSDPMPGEAEYLAKRTAYVDSLRSAFRRERLTGFAAVILGALIVFPSRFVAGWPEQVIWAGYALLALGWALLLYATVRRTAWRRTHPFNPNA